jgi:hypothetical protein
MKMSLAEETRLVGHRILNEVDPQAFVSRNPFVVGAAVALVAGQMTGSRISLEGIAQASNLSTGSIRTARNVIAYLMTRKNQSGLKEHDRVNQAISVYSIRTYTNKPKILGASLETGASNRQDSNQDD